MAAQAVAITHSSNNRAPNEQNLLTLVCIDYSAGLNSHTMGRQIMLVCGKIIALYLTRFMDNERICKAYKWGGHFLAQFLKCIDV